LCILRKVEMTVNARFASTMPTRPSRTTGLRLLAGKSHLKPYVSEVLTLAKVQTDMAAAVMEAMRTRTGTQ
jgi:hypothetical protein